MNYSFMNYLSINSLSINQWARKLGARHVIFFAIIFTSTCVIAREDLSAYYTFSDTKMIEKLNLSMDNNTKIIENTMDALTSYLYSDKPPRPLVESYGRTMDINNNWLQPAGDITKSLYTAEYIPIDVYASTFDSNKHDVKVEWDNTTVKMQYKASSNSTYKDPLLLAPKGFSITAMTIYNSDKGIFTSIDKNKSIKVAPDTDGRLATVYLIPNYENPDRNDPAHVGYLAKYSQYQKIKPATSKDSKPTKMQERYRKGRQVSETLKGSFVVETRTEKRSVEIRAVEKSISKTKEKSSNVSGSITVGKSSTVSAEGGFGPVKAKASTTISVNATVSAGHSSRNQESNSESKKDQSQKENSAGEKESTTYETTTVVNYDGKETEVITQLQQRSGKTYQPSEYITVWLQDFNHRVSSSKQLMFFQSMGMNFEPYYISAIEEVDEYVLTDTDAKIINVLAVNDSSLQSFLNLLSERFAKMAEKDASFKPQLDVINGVNSSLSGGYFSHLIQVAKMHWGAHQLQLSKSESGAKLTDLDYSVEHMLNEVVIKNLNKWQRAIKNGQLPQDLLALMNLADNDSINAINQTGVLRVNKTES